jgi:uncharacterized phage protein gp47/JayE
VHEASAENERFRARLDQREVRDAALARGYGAASNATEVDGEVPTLQRMFSKRLRGYRAVGYTISDADDATAADMSIGPSHQTEVIVSRRCRSQGEPPRELLPGVEPPSFNHGDVRKFD